MKSFTNKIWGVLFMLFCSATLVAQSTNDISGLPVNTVTAVADSSKPFILYITGDGGWNDFSRSLSQEFAKKGYPVVALNAKKYFWDKKTAQQTATDVTRLITAYQRFWKKRKVILLGYSFGADVMPFVYNNLGKDLASQVININLLSPSAKTDFEIHIMVMLGGSSGDESVTAAINKISGKPISLIFGENEDEFPIKELTIKNYVSVKLTGGHHYDGDEANVVNAVLKQVPKN